MNKVNIQLKIKLAINVKKLTIFGKNVDHPTGHRSKSTDKGWGKKKTSFNSQITTNLKC